jgi:hypothetical protein
MLLEDKLQPLCGNPAQVYDIIELTDTENKKSTLQWCTTKLPHLIGTPLSILSWAFSLRFLFLLWRYLWNENDRPGFVAACYFGTQVSLLSMNGDRSFFQSYH